MKEKRLFTRVALGVVGLIAFGFAVGTPDLIWGSGDDPFDGGTAFDFSDSFYRSNGIEPSAIVDRLVAQDSRSVVDSAPSSDFADIRINEITGGFDHTGDVLYYAVNGKVMPNGFTNDAAGDEARELADSFRAFIFPKRNGDPVGPGAPNRRQDNIFDTRNGYFSNNPLGLWILTFVRFTDAALNTSEGQDALADLAAENGTDLDGTPVITEVGEIEDLEKDGWVEFRTRNLDGSEGFPWVI